MRRNWIDPILVRIGVPVTEVCLYRSAIRASLGLLAEHSSLRSIPYRVNSTDWTQTGTDEKRNKFKMLAR